MLFNFFFILTFSQARKFHSLLLFALRKLVLSATVLGTNCPLSPRPNIPPP